MQVENNCTQNSHGAPIISGNDDIVIDKGGFYTNMQHFCAIFHATRLARVVFILVFTHWQKSFFTYTFVERYNCEGHMWLEQLVYPYKIHRT